jgi:antitoxin (DNA-binding transcriptional repressor) of toxin-antitoxin stability system
MEDVSLADAKEHLEDLVTRAARGEDVRIVDPKVGSVRLTLARDGTQRRRPRRLGLLEGKMKVPARLLEPMSKEELDSWYGNEP